MSNKAIKKLYLTKNENENENVDIKKKKKKKSRIIEEEDGKIILKKSESRNRGRRD
jgi:hypothetical protein